MNILILHRVRYKDVLYHQAIDHEKHQVFYIGVADKIEEIPEYLRCKKIIRPGIDSVHKEVLAALNELDVRFDRVISINEFELIEAALIREALDIPGPTVAQVEKVRNKITMKGCVDKAGLRSPQYMRLDTFIEGHRLHIPTDRPVILKPVDGASSIDVVRFGNQEHLNTALKEKNTGINGLDVATEPDTTMYELEEYVDGPVLHIDGMVRKGKIEIIIASQYINTLLDFANGIPAGSIQIATTPALVEWSAKVLKAVDIQLGAFHLEAIQSKDGPVFLEIAHRIGGARIAETFSYQTGIHPSIIELGLLIDENFSFAPKYDSTHKYAWFIVPGHHLKGDYCTVSGHEFLRNSPEAIAINEIPKDQKLVKEVSYKENDLPLAGLLKSKSSMELMNIIVGLFSKLRVNPRISSDGIDISRTEKTKHVLAVGKVRQPQKTLVQLGCRITWVYEKVIDLPHSVEDHNRCERILTYTKESIDQLVALVLAIDAIDKIDAVVSFHDSSQIEAAKIAHVLGLPFSLSEAAVENTRNKLKTREILASKGLSKLISTMVSSLSDITKFFEEHPGINQVILKPVSGTASESITKLARHQLSQLPSFDLPFPLLIETFAEGKEYSVESFILNGNYQTLAITEKFKDEYNFVEIGHLVPARVSVEEFKAIDEFIKNVLNALSLTSGVAHSEIIVGKDGIELIETHTRVAGDQISELVRTRTGVDMYALQAKHALMVPIAEDEYLPNETDKHACIVFKIDPPSENLISRIRGAEEIKTWPGVVDVSLTYKVGEKIPKLINSFDRSASVLVEGKSSDEALALAEKAIGRIIYETGESQGI